ncbi:hypothetical protein EDB89DRAFT_1388344 [Lactarius sanguifluus]|nr:hypothetical protein EDB89DRAFT_1388344 [Lactarius sanguifluus]
MKLTSRWPGTQKHPGAAHMPYHKVRSADSPYVHWHPYPTYSPTWPPIRSVQSPPRNSRHEEVITTLSRYVHRFAWLTTSATMRDTPSAVSEQASVGSGKMKGHGIIRTLRKVADEADAVLLVLDAHDTNRGRGKLVEEQVRGGGHAARVRAQQHWCVIVCLHPHTQPPPCVLYSSFHLGSAPTLLHRGLQRSLRIYELKN